MLANAAAEVIGLSDILSGELLRSIVLGDIHILKQKRLQLNQNCLNGVCGHPACINGSSSLEHVQAERGPKNVWVVQRCVQSDARWRAWVVLRDFHFEMKNTSLPGSIIWSFDVSVPGIHIIRQWLR